MNITRCLLATPVFALSFGCASITGTTIQSISVQTVDGGGKEVKGCACELTNKKGKWFVTSPGSTTITRSNDDLAVLCQRNGVDPGRASVVSWTKGSMFGNIVFGGGIGAIIDHNNGAAYEYPALVEVLLGSNKTIDVTKPEGQQVVVKSMDRDEIQRNLPQPDLSVANVDSGSARLPAQNPPASAVQQEPTKDDSQPAATLDDLKDLLPQNK